MVQKIKLWEVGLNLLEKQLIYYDELFFCSDSNPAENTYQELQTCSNFLKFCLQLATLAKVQKGKCQGKPKLP